MPKNQLNIKSILFALILFVTVSLFSPITARAQNQLVRIDNTDASASEMNRSQGSVRLRRVLAGTQAISVQYAVSGSATNGVDYELLSGNITIPSGANTTATILVVPIDDGVFEGVETVIITVSADDCANATGPCSATVSIADNDPAPLPSVSLSGSASVNEGSAGPATAVVSRTGPTASPLTVRYSVGGTAVAADYMSLSGSVIIPAGAPSAGIPIQWTNDALQESNETIVLTLSNNAAYQVASPSSATLTIIDNDARVTVQASSPVTTEGAGTLFTLTRSTVTDTALIVRFAMSGTAANGTDYSAISSPLTIPANATTVNVAVNTLDDVIVELDETVILTVQTGGAPDYVVGSPGSATVTIGDDDVLPTVTIALNEPSIVDEGVPGSATAVVSRSGRQLLQ